MSVADIQSLQNLLTQGEIKSILVILPQNPSIDATAAGLSLAMALEKRGYAVTVSSPSPVTVELNRLVGVNKIREDLGDKNLILSFANYPADNIEKVSYNIDNGQFFLTVIPKPGNKAPGQENVTLNYAGIGANLVIVVGANYPEGLGIFAQNKEFTESLPNVTLALLGNSPLSGWPKALELIDASGVSISETAYQVLQALAVPLDEDLATNLFLGLESGTANFTAPTVRSETFTFAGDLLKAGARRSVSVTAQMPQFAQPAPVRQTMPEDLSAFRDSSNIG